MKKNEVPEMEAENELIAVTVNTKNIPGIIAGSIDDISKLENEVKNSEESAKKAMDYVSSQMKEYKEKGVWIFRHRSGNTKDIIEDTQEAVRQLAEAQHVSVKALEKSFEFQKKLADASKYIFELGCTNLAMNRIAVRAIEAKLNGASKEEISELAKQEMMNVIRQLKGQEDILKKQEFLTSKVKENVSRLNEKDAVDEEQSSRIKEIENNLNRRSSNRLSIIAIIISVFAFIISFVLNFL